MDTHHQSRPSTASDEDGTLQQSLTHPAETLISALQRVPGAGAVRGAADTVLDLVGAVSPRSRRMAAYAGTGLLKAVAVIDWPFTAAGAAADWLTQNRAAPRPKPGPTPVDVARVAQSHQHEHVSHRQPEAPGRGLSEQPDTPSDRLPPT